ncbi:unnamed protein product [Lymnaea stagnalis]|uniref:Ribosomal protein eL8/eL30/eS12/Gadd45 domain-containing protein n=1 Tax=Lymnaea stagnalis TaxID=6523 RepID=A0AAV2HIA0_LYMST
MSTTNLTTDKKSVGSSLSADAAEFVPLFGTPSPTNSTTSSICDPSKEPLVGSTADHRWKGGKPVEINEVPRYLTSCYPFVAHDGLVRPDISRFPQPFPYSGNVAVSASRQVHFPQWQGVRPGFIGYPTSSYRPLPGSSALPIDVTKVTGQLNLNSVTGDGLLPTPAQLGVPIPGQGLLLTPQPDPMAPWLLGAAPPVYVPHPTQQYLPQQQVLLSTATTYLSTGTTPTTACTSDTKLVTGNQNKQTGGVRPSSPICISRSSQTDFPIRIRNLTLQEKPGLKVVVKSNQKKSNNIHSSKPGDQDSDSGYNSPMHQPNNVTIGTQVSPQSIASSDDKAGATEAQDKEKITEQKAGRSFKNSGQKDAGKEKGNSDSAGNKLRGDDGGSESYVEGKRKKRQKKDQRDRTRSPKLLGANTKLLSRSSSSLSSSGTKPDDDDEKIDLHSWTDFPPMSARGPPSSASSKSPQTLNLEKRVPLTIERSAHEPPWSIKFSTLDESKSERCRSASGDKDKTMCAATVGDRDKSVATSGQVLSAAPDSAWSCIGRSFKSSQRAGLDQERSVLMPVPEVSHSVASESGHDPTRQGKNLTKHFKSTTDLVGKLDKSDGTSPESKTAWTLSAVSTRNSTPSTTSTFVLSSASTATSTTTTLKSATALGTYLTTSKEQSKPNLKSGGQKVASQAGVKTSLDFNGADSVAQTWPSAVTPTTHNIKIVSGSTDLSNMGASVQHAAPFSVNIPLSSNPAVRSYANIAQVTANPSSGIFHRGLHTPATRGASQNISAQSPYQNGSLPYGMPFSMAGVPGFPFYPGNLNQPPPPLSYGSVPLAANFPAPQLQSGNFQSVNYNTAATIPCTKNMPPGPVSGMMNNLPQGAHRSAESHMTATIQLSDKDQVQHCETKAGESEEEEKKKRRRRRRRTRSKRMDSEGSPAAETALSSSNVSESTLHFEDVDEFPDLLPASRGLGEDSGNVGERATLSGMSVTYSDIIKSTFSKAGSQSRTQSLTGSCVSGENEDDDGSYLTSNTNESKRARKRRKRREHANKAAEAELAEISLEQQWLKEVGLKKSGHQAPLGGKSNGGIITDAAVVSEAKRQAGVKTGGKKSQQPIAFDIAAMIEAIQKKPPPPTAPSSNNKHSLATAPVSSKGGKKAVGAASNSSSLPGNMLDSSAPVQKRGKEREVGKAKKPSPLKKVILKEREQKKRLRLLDEDPAATGLDSVGGAPGVGIVGGESELSQDALSSKSDGTDGGEGSGAAELSADLSPISQTSPISMSPASPGNSGVNSPVTGSLGRDPVVMKIHSRRFREYCTQILDKEIDQCCTSLLQDLVKFQDRMYHKDPVKAKTKRRIVLGLREVTKHLKLKKIKCVVISPNLEKIQSKGGLDEALNNLLNMCQEQTVPFVFALGRRVMGRACAKLVPVSVVGIFKYEGCESKYHSLISLTAAARAAYDEMALALEKEVAEYPTMASQTSSIGGVPGLFATHMGHSRTPSGCNAISFTSSIMSEPNSKNFPHAETEVYSKGYEIVRDAAGNVVHPSGGGDQDWEELAVFIYLEEGRR